MSVNNETEKKIINLIDIFNNQSFDEVIKQATKLYKFNNISILPNLIGASYAGKKEHKKAIIFYEKLGYVKDFERFGYIENSSCIFMKKLL